MKQPPCMGCTKRMVNCHPQCEEYLTWKKAKAEENRKEQDKRNEDYKQLFFLNNSVRKRIMKPR